MKMIEKEKNMQVMPAYLAAVLENDEHAVWHHSVCSLDEHEIALIQVLSETQLQDLFMRGRPIRIVVSGTEAILIIVSQDTYDSFHDEDVKSNDK